MTQPRNEIAAMFDQVWDDADFRFDIKAQEVATDLARALHESGMSRAELCEKLGWQPSRVSKVLGGGANLTLKTLQQLSGALGLEFDVILRGPGQARAAQPWEARHLEHDIRRLHDEIQHHHARSQQMLETARQLNRNAWQRTSHVDRVMRAGHVFTDVPAARGGC